MCLGMGLPGQEALLIDLCITKLAAEKKLKDIRFFGKIIGLQGDYLIVESQRWYPDKDHKNYVEKHNMPDPPRKKVCCPCNCPMLPCLALGPTAMPSPLPPTALAIPVRQSNCGGPPVGLRDCKGVPL